MSFEVNENKNSINFRFPSKLELVNRVIDEIHIFFHQQEVEHTELHNLNLVLRELINNAIEHGNSYNEDAAVQCTVENIGGRRFKIEVEDQGVGFDHKAIDWEIPGDPGQARTRGLALVNNLTDRVKFNEKGNQVTAYISLTKKTVFEVAENKKENSATITPSGDVTADVEGPFRLLLQELLDKGVTTFRLDFHRVNDIDSVGLSVLVLLSKKLAGNENAVLEIENLPEDLRQLFRLTRLDRVYRVIKEE